MLLTVPKLALKVNEKHYGIYNNWCSDWISGYLAWNVREPLV